MAEKVIFAEQTLTGFTDGSLIISPAPFVLTEGETYRVVWDGVEHECVCASMDGAPFITDADNLEEPTSLTFFIQTLADDGFDYVLMVAYDLSSGSITGDIATEHTVAIYLDGEVEDSEEGIVLKDRNGNDVAYYGIETVTFDTTTEGKQQVFTKGEAVEGLEIVPDFSEGDMPVNAPAGALVKSAVVKQPEGLTPGNIRNGVEVAGVTGDFIGDTEEVTVDLAMADGDQVIAPSADGKVLSHVVVKRPDTLVPENIAEDVDIGGVIGSFKGGSDNVIQIVPNGDSMVQWFQTRQNFNSEVVVPEAITNLSQTFYSCYNFNQPVTMRGNVTNMYETFYRCNNFNQPITVTGNNLVLDHAFGSCSNFNQPVTISGSCHSASNAFGECYNFNQPVAIPDTCTNISYLFYYCKAFNQPFTIPSNATAMTNTFYLCSNFNQPVTLPSNITSLAQTFIHCNRFDQPVIIPNKVTSLWNTFCNCPNMQNITILSTNVNYLAGMVRNTNNSVRLNIHVPPGSTTNTTTAYTNTYSVIGNTITWTTDSANKCRYNTTYNIYIYWDL